MIVSFKIENSATLSLNEIGVMGVNISGEGVVRLLKHILFG